MELNQIRYFLTLSRELNFTRAAELCHVSQPALTKAVKNLEDELGGELFRRERGNSHLTDLGRLMQPHLEQVLAAAEQAKVEAGSFKSAKKAPLKLGVMCTISPHVMVDFLRAVRDPLPTVELSISELPGTALIEAMMKGALDVALIGMPKLPARLDAVPLYTERYGVAFPRGHRFEKMNAVPMRELTNENYVERVLCEFDDHWNAMNPGWAVDVKVRFRSEREDWVQAMLAAGMGCAVMPEFLPRLSGVVLRLLVEPEVGRTISLVTVSGRRFSPATKALVQLARNHRWELG
ncbi:MAG: LysR family transcriptional regulator [Rhodospirillaceae bacterium]|nr:LysR family transcriptional regulator [Rhodospirillaceae bacterium]